MADYRKEGNVGIVTINNPPVNALSARVVNEIHAVITRATADNDVQAIVVTGQGKNFSAGADIHGFQDKNRTWETTFVEMVELLARCPKPVVAAINGFAFGGGLEICLGCHYRVAHTTTRTGFPEVQIGLLPGGTGTQLFPRLVGLQVAMDLITSGRHITAAKAKSIGLFDQLVAGDVLPEAVKLARQVVGKPIRRLYEATPKDAANVAQIYEATLAKVARAYPGLMAPVLCAQAVRNSAESPYEKGIIQEASLMLTLLTSSQAKGLQYAFFAQRQATKWKLPDGSSHKSYKPSAIKSCGVVGAGTMGSGIGMAVMNAGIPVVLVEQSEEFLNKGVDTIKKLYAGSVKLGKLSRGQADKILTLLTPTTDWNALKDVDMVVEAVYENLDLKKTIFKRLDAICSPKTLLCSNTSNLDIDQIAAVTNRPDKVMGTHFFVPAYYMKLLENIRGEKTSPETIATVTAWGSKIGKVPVLVGNCFGFVGNRMLYPYAAESVFLLEEGCLPHEVDEVIKNFGIPIGPCEVSDLSGLDIGYLTRQEIARKFGEEDNTGRFRFGRRYSPLPDLLVEKGRMGRKSGGGWYRYERPGAKVPMIDTEVTQFILKYCKAEGIDRRQITPQEILERCLYSLINEGFKILEEGIVSRPEEIDTIWTLGYGWPRHTGGPMFYASQVGLKRVYDRVCYYHEQHPTSPHWEPSRLLAQAAKDNASLASLETTASKL